jgi:hypothetical protein
MSSANTKDPRKTKKYADPETEDPEPRERSLMVLQLELK